MNGMRLRLTSAALTLVLAAGSTAPVWAQEDVPPTDPYAAIAAAHGWVQVDAAPAGLQPIQVASPDEFQSLATQFDLASEPVTAIYQMPASRALPGIGTMSGSTNYSTFTRECTRPLTPATFYTQADIRVGVNGSFRWIDSVQNTRTGLSGIVVTVQLVNPYNYIRSQTATRVEIVGGGQVNAVMQTPLGTMYFWSEPTSCEIIFSVY